MAGSIAVVEDAKMASSVHQSKHSGAEKAFKPAGSDEEIDMSGDGVTSFRGPRSLLERLRAAAAQQGISIHEAVRRVVFCLASLSNDELISLPEPPRELNTPKISLYIGWDAIDELASVARDGTLSNSQTLRRVLYGLLITKNISFVQRDGDWKLQIRVTKHKQNSGFLSTGKAL
jgi:hypothetical protein